MRLFLLFYSLTPAIYILMSQEMNTFAFVNSMSVNGILFSSMPFLLIKYKERLDNFVSNEGGKRK